MMATKCSCLHQCPDNAIEGVCLLKPGGYCFTLAEAVFGANGTVVSEITRGCLPPDVEGMLQCKGARSPHLVPKNVTCCRNEDFCNTYSFPRIDQEDLDDLNREFQNGPLDWKLCFAVGIGALVGLFIVGFIMFLFYRRYKLNKKGKFEKKHFESDDSIQKGNYSFQSNSFKPLLPVPQFPNIVTPRIPIPYTHMANSSASSSDSSGSTPHFKYNYLNNSASHSSSHNGSNYNINHYRNFSSTTSHTTSSMASELTQQTTLSSQKPTSNGFLPPLNETSVSSGSGSGAMHLVQMTLAREIHLGKLPIGAGRYGEVYHGKRRGDDVAVKIFYSRDEASWKREVEIYSTVIMRHENILGYLGADMISWNGCTQLWLVTEYHEMGSLFNYLLENPIKSIPQMLALMKSIICGLEHLHTEVIGTQGKPAIAHRDIKSKNLLMKKGGFSCCIADFGLAVTKTQTNQVNIAQNHRVGTKRFMAPEALNDTMQNDFEFYKCADIYSLALVFWELYNRLEMNGEKMRYMIPFENDVPKDPSFEDMRKIICEQKMRPPLEKHLEENEFEPTLASVRTLISEGWKEKPSARLTALNIKKKIISLMLNVSRL